MYENRAMKRAQKRCCGKKQVTWEFPDASKKRIDFCECYRAQKSPPKQRVLIKIDDLFVL